MKLKFTNILLLLFSLLGCSSCLHEKLGVCPGDEPDGAADGSQYVYLNMSVGVESPSAEARSRAEEVNDDNYFEDAATKYERMNTLRVIIVRGKQHNDIIYSPDSAGYIEHNRLFNLTEEGLIKYDNMTFKVHAGEEKKIYFIANEKYVVDTKGVDFEDLTPRGLYPDNFIEDITLSSSEAGEPLIDNDGESKYYLPMSESFDFNLPLPEHPSDYEVKKEFFVTRAAVKFSFNILTPDYPDYDSGLRIKDITVNQIGNTEFLLPRAEYSPDKYSESSFPDNGRFITSYTLPTDPEPINSSYVFDTGIKDRVLDYTDSNKGVHPFIPHLYFPESYQQDKYTVSITLGDDNPANDFTFEPAELKNLPNLPRNTHVLVNILLNKADIEATVKLVPYIGVYLNYPFGFVDLVPWKRPDNNNDDPSLGNDTDNKLQNVTDDDRNASPGTPLPDPETN